MRKRLLLDAISGTENIPDEYIRRHVLFSNIIYLTLPLVYLAFMIVDITQSLPFHKADFFIFDRVIVPITISFCIFCYWLNRIGYHVIGRCAFILLWPILLHILPIIIQHSPSDYYFAFPVGLIFHSVLIQAAFSHKKEKFLFWSFLLANFVLLIFSLSILRAHDLRQNEFNLVSASAYYRIDAVHYWLLFNLLTYYLFYAIENSIEKLKAANDTIISQRNILEEQNTEMEQLLESLANSNKLLESNVASRTAELLKKNEQLIQYAHFNAHQLRGPYARVRGLINLIHLSETNMNNTELQKRLLESLDELEAVISYIQRTVE